MTSEQKPKEAYKEYWIEGNEIAPFVYLASTKYFPDTPGCKIIHVIEYSAYEQLQQENAKLKEQLKIAIDALNEIEMQNNDRCWYNVEQICIQTLKEIRESAGE